jgi:hypothetical protein
MGQETLGCMLTSTAGPSSSLPLTQAFLLCFWFWSKKPFWVG